MEEKIKVIMIAHCSHSYFLGEGEKDLKKLFLNDWYVKTAKQLNKFYPKIEVECWAPEKLNIEKEEMILEGVKFKFFPVTFSPIYALDLSISMIKELKGEVRKSKEENYKLIIHIHEIHNLHGLLITTLFKNQKIIVQHHGGSWPLKHIKQTKRYKFFFPIFLLAQIWENLVLRNVDYFYALSEDEINYLRRVAPNSTIRFQTMGIDEEYFKKVNKKTARKKLNLGNKEKILIYIGRINDVKGVGFLLEAMNKLKEENILLKIIGFGPQEDKFKKYVKDNNLKNVEFLGGVFGEKKLLYLSASDAFVLPSSKEGAPVTVMEALAKNLPVVVTNVGGTPLMVKNGREGIIIPPRNSEEIVSGIREVLKWEKRDIKKYAEIYKWEKIIKETVGDYNGA